MQHVTRRQFLSRSTAGLALCAGMAQAEAKPRPLNVLWITCEDMSLHLGCYGDAYANTPNLDQLAGEGQRYTHAFSVAGVCAPSRSCLITGMYPTTLGTCHMRCIHTPPSHVRCFPTYLRREGYYCTNNVKTDYQFAVPDDAWDACSDAAHWRNRKNPEQPFFAVFNSTFTHESRIGDLSKLPKEYASRIPGGLHDPARATLPPWYPDTEVIRKHWAHMYDLASAMDVWAGDLLAQLAEDGLADNTVVFFFSDHGDGIPRAKRWMYDSGLHVPFMVRWPGKIEPGSVTERLVSFLDFAPTVLSIAGVDVPEHMQGTAFLGKSEGAPRTHVFAARDRMDERYDLIRATRDKRYKYIRNYLPDRPYAQYVSYCESWPIMQELRRVHEAGGLNESQGLFFRDGKPLEELYDTENDPHELSNLAEDPKHADVLQGLRKELDAWLDGAKDLGFVPETELEKWVPSSRPKLVTTERPEYEAPRNATGDVFGKPLSAWVEDLNDSASLRRIRAAATLALAGEEAAPVLLRALDDPDVCVAYWAAAGLGNARVTDPGVMDALGNALGRESKTVRLAAADALCALDKPDTAIPAVLALMDDPDLYVRLAAIHILEGIDPKPEPVMQALRKALEDKSNPSNNIADVARHALGLAPVH
ncbi:MAG: sulfatase-like hydrolase/transferase [Candidatus Hydrogenedentales bacterium]